MMKQCAAILPPPPPLDPLKAVPFARGQKSPMWGGGDKREKRKNLLTSGEQRWDSEVKYSSCGIINGHYESGADKWKT